jgi:hypothetical protein
MIVMGTIRFGTPHSLPRSWASVIAVGTRVWSSFNSEMRGVRSSVSPARLYG